MLRLQTPKRRNGVGKENAAYFPDKNEQSFSKLMDCSSTVVWFQSTLRGNEGHKKLRYFSQTRESDIRKESKSVENSAPHPEIILYTP